MEDLTPILPAHIEDTIRSIARLHAEHHQAATPVQRVVDRVTAFVGRPRFIGTLTVVAIIWIGANLVVLWSGHAPVDPPPFPWLDGVVGIGALYIALLILTTQRHADQLAQHREQLTLELAILNEQKTAKVIELLEEMRRPPCPAQPGGRGSGSDGGAGRPAGGAGRDQGVPRRGRAAGGRRHPSRGDRVGPATPGGKRHGLAAAGPPTGRVRPAARA